MWGGSNEQPGYRTRIDADLIESEASGSGALGSWSRLWCAVWAAPEPERAYWEGLRH